MARVLLPLLLLLIVAAAIIASDRPMPRADLRISNGIDVTTLDPQRASWTNEIRVGRLLFEGLVANDVFDHDYAIIPGVAERWEVSDDQLEYRFFLREDAAWSNGAPVTAHDFAFAWRRAILPDTAADYYMFFEYIEGVAEFFRWRTDALERFAAESGGMSGAERAERAAALWAETERRFVENVGIEVAGEREIAVRLRRPVPFFLDLIAFGSYYPVYRPLVEQYDRLDPQTARINAEGGWTKPPHVVTNGPFQLTVWRFRRDMRFEQNPHYWNADAINVRSIEIPSIADPNAQVLAFQTGAVDYVANVTAAYRREMVAQKRAFYRDHWDEYQRLLAEGWDTFQIDRMLPDDPRKVVHTTAAFGTYFWNFNCLESLPDGRPNPLADPRVRRAFALMIDKRVIVDEVRGLGEPVARTLIPPGSVPGYESPEGLPCLSDCTTAAEREALIARAKALIAEAGFTDPADMPVIELAFNKDAGHDLVAQAVAKNWQETLGVQVRLAQQDLNVFRDDLKKHNFMTARAGWYGDYPDPLTFLEINRTGDGNNDRAFSNATFDGLLDSAYDEIDTAKRAAILSEAERMIMEDELPMIPIFHYANVFMFDASKLSGPNPHPRTNENFSLYDLIGDGIGSDTVRMMPKRAR